MALKLRRTSASRVKLLSTLIAVFALLVQPMYGFVASQVANAAQVDTVATNLNSEKTYADVEAAIDEATKGDVIRLEKDITLGNPTVRIRKQVTLDGNGKTVSTTEKVPYPRLPANGVYNAAFIVLANNVELKNMTIDGAATDRTAHGVVVDKSLSGIKLNDITARNGAAGLIVNGSDVTVKNIATSNNAWYGINVDNGGKLTVLGISKHDENKHIYIEKRDGVNKVVESQYARYWSDGGYNYLVDSEKPTIKLFGTSYNPTSFEVKAGDDQGLSTIGYSILRDGERVGVWGQGAINSENKKSLTETKTTYKLSKDEKYHKLSDLIEGTYKIYANATDILQKSTEATPYEFIVDHKNPTISAELVGGTENPTGVKGVIKDTLSGADYAEYSIGTGVGKEYKYIANKNFPDNDKLMADADGNFSGNIDTSGLTDGSYTLRVRGFDKAGNKKSGIDINFSIDTKGPAAPTITPGTGIIKGNQEFLITAEQGATIDAVADQGVLNGANGTYTLDTSTLRYGTKVKITSWATDTVGNPGEKTIAEYTVQNDGPVISNVKVSSDRPSFSQTVTGRVSPVAGTSVSVIANGQTYPATVNSDGTWSRVIDVTGYSTGRYTFSVIAQDQYKNRTQSTAPYSFNVTSPVTPPIDRQNNFGPVANPARLFSASNVIAVPVTAADEDVLGARDTAPSSPEKTVAVIEPSAQGWKLFGFAWFWWVLLGAAIAAGWWMIAAARRRRDENAY